MPDVTQADRAAAADYLDATLGQYGQQTIRDGMEDEHPLVQAFARHRTAEAARIAELEEEMARLREQNEAMSIELQVRNIAVANAAIAKSEDFALFHGDATALGGKAEEKDPNILHIRIDRRHCSGFSLEIDDQASTSTALGGQS